VGDERWKRGASLAGKIDGVSERLDRWSASQSKVPELRQRVRALAEEQWGAAVDVVHLGDDKPRFDVPGRRRDGTVKGTRLVRRFFWNIVRGVVNGVVNVFLIFNAGGGGNVFAGRGSVTGPANAQALAMADAVRSAKDAWLVFTSTSTVDDRRSGYAPAHVAVVDLDGAPTVRWHAQMPDTPRLSPTRQRITWPDDSVYQYDVTREEAKAARDNH
jgi:hypothetical protein